MNAACNVTETVSSLRAQPLLTPQGYSHTGTTNAESSDRRFSLFYNVIACALDPYVT